jgi:type III pantothenate kinase
MLLAIDIGNTDVKLGVFEAAKLRATWRVSTDTARLADEYGVTLIGLLEVEGIKRSEVDSAVIGSVVPTLTSVFEALCRRYFGVTALRVGAGVKTGLRILYEDPREVGPDRIAGAVAALRLHQPPLIVVSAGTATVFEAISRDREYLGGAIAPGIGVAIEALAQRAAMLRSVDLQPPKHAIGTNTAAAMQSGTLFGYVELVEGMVRRFKAELGGEAYVIGTGGWSRLLSEQTRAFDTVDPELTLQGLRLIYEMNLGE